MIPRFETTELKDMALKRRSLPTISNTNVREAGMPIAFVPPTTMARSSTCHS